MRIDKYTYRTFEEMEFQELHLAALLRAEEEPEPEIPPAPTFSEEELAARCAESRQHGYSEGYKEGYDKAKAEVSHNQELIVAAVQKITGSITAVAGEITAAFESSMDAAHSLALAIARKVAEDAINSYPMERVKTVLAETLPLVIEKPRIVIKVSQEIESEVAKEAGHIISGFASTGEIVIIGASGIAPGDCLIEWQGGAIRSIAAESLREIETIIESNLSIAPKTPPLFTGGQQADPALSYAHREGQQSAAGAKITNNRGEDNGNT